MDVRLIYNGVEFVYDEHKEIINIEKHDLIDFEEAVSSFFDPFAIEAEDPEHSQYEERFIIVGMSAKLRIIMVCFCYREEDTVRVFSARKAKGKLLEQYKKAQK